MDEDPTSTASGSAAAAAPAALIETEKKPPPQELQDRSTLFAVGDFGAKDEAVTDAESSFDGDEEDEEEMPLLYYKRLFGSLPRTPTKQHNKSNKKNSSNSNTKPAPLAIECTCSVLGKVVLNYNTTNQKPISTSDQDETKSPNRTSAAAEASSDDAESSHPHSQHQQHHQQHQVEGQDIPVKQWQDRPVSIAACGFQDGSVRLMDAVTATAIIDTNDYFDKDSRGSSRSHSSSSHSNSNPFYISEISNHHKKPIVAVSLDASGTTFSAIDTEGNCVTWTVKYGLQYRSTEALQQQQTSRNSSPRGDNSSNSSSKESPSASGLSRFFWGGKSSKGGDKSSPTSKTDGDNATSATERQHELVPTLTLAEVKIQRWQYTTTEYGVPTCLCLDPAFKQHKPKLMVAFDSGKIVLTSRNWMLQAEHTVLPYTGPVTAKDWRGIEALQWRGTLVAFCDCSGVKLFDTSTLRPIAHVDRPTGARPSLYPSTIPVVPSLSFETSRNLLVAWGDCLMDLRISESGRRSHSANNNTGAAAAASTPTTDSSPTVTRKRTVACTMAWGLDCVAAGVVPIDASHIGVLGLIREDDGGDDDKNEEGVDVSESSKLHGGGSSSSEVELQIIDRHNGFVVHADLLALAEPEKPATGRFHKSSTSSTAVAPTHFRLLSTFAVPRMEDAAEVKEVEGDPGLVASIVGTGGLSPKTEFIDPHFQWNLKMVAYDDDEDEAAMTGGADGETDSVDSDDYGFIRRPMVTPAEQLVPPPIILVFCSSDAILARVRNVDDAVSFALERKKPATALRRALPRVRKLKRYSVNDLVGEYLRSLLRLPKAAADASGSTSVDVLQKQPQQLSLRRMKLAAEALPLLLGGNVDLWQTWVAELEKIPGALFVVRNYLPVRDPRLPKNVYAQALGKMLEEVEDMRYGDAPDIANRLAKEAERHFLNTLVAWGTTKTLKEHVKLYEYQSSLDDNFEGMRHLATESLNRRNEQTAVGYLELSSAPSVPAEIGGQSSRRAHASDAMDSLYQVDDLIATLARRTTFVKTNGGAKDSSSVSMAPVASDRMNSSIALEALAKLYMMKGSHDEALKCYLVLGALHAPSSLEEIEEKALAVVNETSDAYSTETTSTYAFILNLIERHHLHQYLLESNFLPESLNTSPICALIRLVGLGAMADFLVQHCIAPQQARGTTDASASPIFARGSKSCKTRGERRGTLPLDLVTDQLSGSPKLFHWYLHLIFVRKPEVYVKFPNTANPPSVIVNLHKKHLDLYIKYAGPNRDSAKALAGVESYRVAEKSTPLLSFMRTILPLGTIGPMEIGRKLEIERRGGAGGILALELAYFMENYGEDSLSEAKLIIDLYLSGAQSLVLAVAYAQRNKTHSPMLWESLINHCLPGLGGVGDHSVAAAASKTVDGSLFGSLLEAAALSGADLAKLVEQIPQGMQVEGLRPRLVAAIADYRLKVQLHRTSSEIAVKEKGLLFQEATIRSRRGMLYDGSDEVSQSMLENLLLGERETATTEEDEEPKSQTLSPTLRTKNRPARYSHCLSIAIR